MYLHPRHLIVTNPMMLGILREVTGTHSQTSAIDLCVCACVCVCVRVFGGLCACVCVVCVYIVALPSILHTMTTGWRRPIGSPKLQIIFHKRATKYRSLFRKMTYKDRDPMSLHHPVHSWRLIIPIADCFWIDQVKGRYFDFWGFYEKGTYTDGGDRRYNFSNFSPLYSLVTTFEDLCCDFWGFYEKETYCLGWLHVELLKRQPILVNSVAIKLPQHTMVTLVHPIVFGLTNYKDPALTFEDFMRRENIVCHSTDVATPSKFTWSWNSNSSVQSQMKPKSQFEFVHRTEISDFLDLVDFGDVALSVETVIGLCKRQRTIAMSVQSIVFGMSCYRNLKSQSRGSLFSETGRRRPRERDQRLRFENAATHLEWHSKCNGVYNVTQVSFTVFHQGKFPHKSPLQWLLHSQFCSVLLFSIGCVYIYVQPVAFAVSTTFCNRVCEYIYTACCMWRVIHSFSNPNRWSSSLGLFCHVPLKRDQRHWDWRLRLNDTANAIGCPMLSIYISICIDSYSIYRWLVYATGCPMLFIHMSLYTYLSIHISLYISLSIHISLYTYLSLHISLSIHISLYSYLSLYISLSLHIALYSYLSIHISLYIYHSPYISLSLYISLSIHIYLYSHFSLYISLSIHISLSLHISFYTYLSIHISLYTYLSLYNSLYTHLSLYISLSLHISLYTYLSQYTSLSIHISLSTYLSIHISLYTHLSLVTNLSIHISLSTYLSLYIPFSMHISL